MPAGQCSGPVGPMLVTVDNHGNLRVSEFPATRTRDDHDRGQSDGLNLGTVARMRLPVRRPEPPAPGGPALS